MSNFKILLNHEIHRQFKSFKVLTMFLLAFVVSLSVSYVRINDYKEKHATYQEEVKRAEEKLKNIQVYSELEVSVFVPPNPLTIFAIGFDDKVGNKAVVSATHYPGIESTSQKANPFLNLFVSMDVTGVVKLFSVFIILMAAGAISGEREDKTLKMIFVTSVNRVELFLAKYLSFIVIVLCSLVVIFVIPTLLIITNTQIATNSGFIQGVFVLLLTSLMYLSVFILLSLLISSITSTATHAISTALFIWLGVVYIYPQITTSLAKSIHKSPSKVELDSEIKRIDSDLLRTNTVHMFNNSPKGPKNIYYGYEFDTSTGGREGWVGYNKIGLTQKYHFEFYKDFIDMQISGLSERHQTVGFLEDRYNNSLLKQASFFNTVNILIPDVIYARATEKLANTGRLQREQQFKSAIHRYRDLFMEYLSSKDGLGYSFFTHATESMMKDDFYSYSKEDYERAKLIAYNIKDIPKFTFDSRLDSYTDIILLIVVNMILMILGLVLFYKSKVI